MPLSQNDAARVYACFHVFDRESILFHFIFGMPGQLILANGHFASYFSNLGRHSTHLETVVHEYIQPQG